MNKPSSVVWSVLAVALVAAALTWAIIAARDDDDAPSTPSRVVLDRDGKVVGSYRIPNDNDIAGLPNAADILYGKRLLNETARLLPQHVGAALNCNSCHVSEGKLENGAPYINTFNTFPQFSTRAGKEINLKQRINGCFLRSMNGKAIDPGSREMTAMIAYMEWLAQKVPAQQRIDVVNAGKIDTSLVPDPVRGKQIYADQCAACHGGDGEGMQDQAGYTIFPPLWGDRSFNLGAGTARTYKAAAFVKYNMPFAVNRNKPAGQGGVLSDQDAIDVAEFFTHQPRPDFPGRANDWPNEPRPKDAR